MKNKSRNIVILPFGNKSLNSAWIWNKEGRNFDVVLLFYHESIPDRLKNDQSGAFEIYHLKNFKWIMIQEFFRTRPDTLTNYDYFFFIDDDVEMQMEDINFLFQNIRRFSLEMSQPVLTRNSYKSWKALRRKLFSGLRYVSSVELMCPVMSSKAVKLLLPVFTLNQSGWGIDILWGEMIRKEFGPKSIGVFDIIRAAHLKPMGKGEMYKKLGKPENKERDEIFSKYQLKETYIYTLRMPENGFFKRLKSYFDLRQLRKDFIQTSTK